MTFKKFIAVSFILSASVCGKACSDISTHNYYLFSLHENELQDLAYARPRITHPDYQQRILDNWNSYAGTSISEYDAGKLKTIARRKGDNLMVQYISLLERYLAIAKQSGDSWDYPTARQKAQRAASLKAIRTAAAAKTSSRLRSQYGLLYMRTSMMLGMHSSNIQFWEQKATSMPNSVYRDMMLNIYAGALAHSGKDRQACEIFASQNDYPSIYNWMLGKRNLKGISKIYAENPNSAILPFLIQEFVNNAQETVDDENAKATKGYNAYGKLFVRGTYRDEVMKFCDFAHTVCNEGRTSQPSMWMTAAAWLHYMFGRKDDAQMEIDKAVDMTGTVRMRDNARAIRLFITAGRERLSSKDYDCFVASELSWLYDVAQKDLSQSDYNLDNHYTQVMDRLISQVLTSHYDKAGRSNVATALIGIMQYLQDTNISYYQSKYLSESGWSPSYSTDFFERIDTMSAERTKSFLGYLKSDPSSSLDRWLIAHNSKEYDYLRDIIGTQYLRSGNMTAAADYLGKVALSFLDKQNIAGYMSLRDFEKDKWYVPQRQEMDYSDSAPVIHLTSNMKLRFARTVNDLEAKYIVSDGDARTALAYRLGSMYYQASHLGDCWFITHYGWSVSDSARNGETDFVARAVDYLTVAATATDFRSREDALYALAFIPDDAWFVEGYDSDFNTVVKYRTESRQYKALATLVDFENRNSGYSTNKYISRCDVLKRFMKFGR